MLAVEPSSELLRIARQRVVIFTWDQNGQAKAVSSRLMLTVRRATALATAGQGEGDALAAGAA